MYSKNIENAVIAKIKELKSPIKICERDFPYEFIKVDDDYVLIEVRRERSWYEIYAMVFVNRFSNIDEFKEAFAPVINTAPNRYGYNFILAPVYDYWFSVDIDIDHETQDANMYIQNIEREYIRLIELCNKEDVELVQNMSSVIGIYEDKKAMIPYGACCIFENMKGPLSVKEVADMTRRGMLSRYLNIMTEMYKTV